MKEFITAVDDEAEEQEREDKIKALMERAENPLSRADAENEVDRGTPIEFKLDDRVMRAYRPSTGQLAFMMAALGRGQTKDQRFSAILNIMFESLHEDDKDYLESRLLTSDKNRRLKVERIEGVFEYLMEEWFRPSVPDGGTPV